MVCWPVFRWRVKTRSVCAHTQPQHLLTCFRWRVKTRRKMKTSSRRSMMGCWSSQRVMFCLSWPDWWGAPPSLPSSPPSSQTCSNDWLVSALTSCTGVVSFFASVSVCCITWHFDSVLISCCSEQTYNKIKTNKKLRVLSLLEKYVFFLQNLHCCFKQLFLLLCELMAVLPDSDAGLLLGLSWTLSFCV